MRSLVASECGIVDPSNRCRCARQVPEAVAAGGVDPARPLFAARGTEGRPVAVTAEMHRLHDRAALTRSHPDYAAPHRLRHAVETLLDEDRA